MNQYKISPIHTSLITVKLINKNNDIEEKI